METAVYPMRINKYLASKKYCTRREADEVIKKGKVFINGKVAVLGDKISQSDVVDVKWRAKNCRYYAYNKPRGIITHSPQGADRVGIGRPSHESADSPCRRDEEEDIAMVLPANLKNVFPVGRLDKDSFGLIILTDDGRIVDPLLNPDFVHEKEYWVTCTANLPPDFKERAEKGLDIGGYVTKPCKIELLSYNKFSITLTEGKKRQIRRMCGVFGLDASGIERKRIMNIKLGHLPPGEHRPIQGKELQDFLKALGF
ncbi:MAG: pseudouridine synthase [bacterium]|nr:pseudouridine synthase [bacterium]